MNQAVANNKSWSSANTSVTYCEENGESRVYLHGNHIATVGDDFSKYLMEVGKQQPPNLVSMHLSIVSAMLSPMVYTSASMCGI